MPCSYNRINLICYQVLKLKIMSSPPIRKHSSSPIRNLDRSPRRSRYLHTILEEEALEQRRTLGLSLENEELSLHNKVLGETVRNYADESHQFALENSQLRRDNQSLRAKNYDIEVMVVQKMARQITLKDAEIQKLKSDVQLLRNYYEKDLDQSKGENRILRNQIIALEKQSFVETEQLRQKYSTIALDDMNLARKTYMDDLKKLIDALDSTKSLLSEKQFELKHLTMLNQNFSQEYSANMEQLIMENNILRNSIMEIEIMKDNQVRQAEAKKQLQKSRTHGILSYCKENNAFMEKQVSKLAEQLLEKSISIDQFTKDILKMRKNQETTERRYEEKINRQNQDHARRAQELEDSIRKMEKYYKEQIAGMRKKQLELIEIIATKQHQNETVRRQLEHTRQELRQKINQLEESKANLAKLHEEHAQQISKVMTDSRVKRRSMKNLSQVSSLRDLSADGNSSIIKKNNLQRQNSLIQDQQGSSGALYTVHEQIARSQIVDGSEDEDIDLKELIMHYENIIEELKSNKNLEMNMANQKIQKLNTTLREKQQQLLEILQRFSPLMEYKLNEQSIEEERKQKIQKHYKADVDILSVLLDKYSIVSLGKNKK